MGNALSRLLGAVGGGFGGYADSKKRIFEEDQQKDYAASRKRQQDWDQFATQGRFLYESGRPASATDDPSRVLTSPDGARFYVQSREEREAATAAQKAERDEKLRKQTEETFKRAQAGDKNAVAELVSLGIPEAVDWFGPKKPEQPSATAMTLAAKEAEEERLGLAYLNQYHSTNERFRKAFDDYQQKNRDPKPGRAAFVVAQAMKDYLKDVEALEGAGQAGGSGSWSVGGTAGGQNDPEPQPATEVNSRGKTVETQQHWSWRKRNNISESPVPPT